MKWYFALNDNSENFYPLALAAVNSALANTTLEPVCIFDGEENDFVKTLKSLGVKVLHHKCSFYEELEKHYCPQLLKIASGAFLRCDIPLLENEEKFVLYTDCDVIFQKEIDFSKILAKNPPKYFSCSVQDCKFDYINFNSGVMLMNVESLKKTRAEFKDFICKNLPNFNAFDQSAYQIFYHGKNTPLSKIYNHKPYWGINKNAVIVHFHGPKPNMFANDKSANSLHPKFINYFLKNPSAYTYYFNEYNKYDSQTVINKDTLEKIQKGELKGLSVGKQPFKVRLERFLTKLALIITRKHK